MDREAHSRAGDLMGAEQITTTQFSCDCCGKVSEAKTVGYAFRTVHAAPIGWLDSMHTVNTGEKGGARSWRELRCTDCHTMPMEQR